MKKIGLCVCYDTKNFGSQLQVLATQKAVEELGYDYEVIRYKKKMTPVFIFQSLPRLFNPYFVKGKIRNMKKKNAIKKNEDIAKQVSIRNKRFDIFVDKYFHKLSEPYVGYDALKENAKKYDGVLTGSDQLWLPGNLGSHFYTQEFVPDDVNKVAYATSFGVGSIPWYQKKRTRRYLNRFQYLSSRELQGSRIIKELTGKESITVADPTLLFSGEEWNNYIANKKVVDGKYIFCYFLGDNSKHRDISEELKAKTGLEIVTIPFLDNFVERDMTFGDKRMYDVDAADFVNLIRNAEYILTDSFHGSVFSILNHKKFVTFNRFMDNSKDSRNSRIDSLCELLGLSERRYNSDIFETVNKEIRYEEVDKRVEKLKLDSKTYLCNALKGSDKQ